ncbi:hypothetical protein [Canibacter zhoujuaniae]|uniref:PH-like domain-containing protein n=1 Tax=Canibacter zhoujuaniae TaxID=2708343 RepID=UPI00141DFD06|nr:hypothetical protein [Canibacter zhoujuaniae]
MNGYSINVIVCAGIVVLALAGMWFGWRKRSISGEALPRFTGTIGEPVKIFERVFYVVTTDAADRRERVLPPGLKYRGWARFVIAESGAVLQVAGEDPTTLAPITGVSLTGTSIAKAVEAAGLVVISWGEPDKRVETHIRFTTTEEQETAVALLENIIKKKETVAC